MIWFFIYKAWFMMLQYLQLFWIFNMHRLHVHLINNQSIITIQHSSAHHWNCSSSYEVSHSDKQGFRWRTEIDHNQRRTQEILWDVRTCGGCQRHGRQQKWQESRVCLRHVRGSRRRRKSGSWVFLFKFKLWPCLKVGHSVFSFDPIEILSVIEFDFVFN